MSSKRSSPFISCFLASFLPLFFLSQCTQTFSSFSPPLSQFSASPSKLSSLHSFYSSLFFCIFSFFPRFSFHSSHSSGQNNHIFFFQSCYFTCHLSFFPLSLSHFPLFFFFFLLFSLLDLIVFLSDNVESWAAQLRPPLPALHFFLFSIRFSSFIHEA